MLLPQNDGGGGNVGGGGKMILFMGLAPQTMPSFPVFLFSPTVPTAAVAAVRVLFLLTFSFEFDARPFNRSPIEDDSSKRLLCNVPSFAK